MEHGVKRDQAGEKEADFERIARASFSLFFFFFSSGFRSNGFGSKIKEKRRWKLIDRLR